MYYEVIDLIVESIRKRFQQESYTIFVAIEKILLTAVDEKNLEKSK